MSDDFVKDFEEMKSSKTEVQEKEEAALKRMEEEWLQPNGKWPALQAPKHNPDGWLIAIPCWGPWYRKIFKTAFKSHLEAIRILRHVHGPTPVRYVIQTDDPVWAVGMMKDFEVTVLPPPGKSVDKYDSLANIHRRALRLARPNERVALLTADIVVSMEAFAAAETHFRRGKRAIVTCATRTLPNWRGVPVGAYSHELLDYSMEHPHPIIESCFWGTGKCALPWAVYFHMGKNTVLRGFHLHPFAVVNDRPLPFYGTLDIGLLDHFDYKEIHVVTDSYEMALVEVSRKEQELPQQMVEFGIFHILTWASAAAGAKHWWNFRHKISIRGSAGLVEADEEVLKWVEQACPYPEALAAPVGV